MKKITIIFLLSIFFTATIGQGLFHENFENPDSVISSGNPGWVLNNSVQTSGLFCDSATAAVGDSSMLTTIPFSTIGQYHIKLKFNHIQNSEFDASTLWISINGGLTWSQITANEYEGPGTFTGNYFTENSFVINPCLGVSCCPFPYLFWQNETFDISALVANQASVQIKFQINDENNMSCDAWVIDDLEITAAPYELSSTFSCNNNGTATLIPHYGSAPYTYSWSSIPIQTTQTANGLSNGTYFCTVTDVGGTSYTDSVKVKSAIDVNVGFSPPTCGMQNGLIHTYLNAQPNPPYSYMWSNGSNTSSINNLSPGTYTLTLTDGIGCVYINSYPLPCSYNSSNLVLTSTGSVCNDSTGTATVQSFSPATPPFTYVWHTTPVQTTQTATGLKPNNIYIVSVNDAIGDSAESYIYVANDDTVIASAIYTPTVCLGNTGTASANALGGVSPYTYLWSTLPIQTTQIATGLSNASYTLTVTDQNGCKDDYTFFLPNDINMTVSIGNTPTQCGLATGSANTFASGGVPPYSYQWLTIPIQTTAIATGLAEGGYSVIITDSNGCVVQKHIFIYSNPTMNAVVNYSSMLCNCVNATVTTTGGVPPYSYLWSDGQTTQTDTCVNLGNHYVRVTDANGCNLMENFYVTYPANCFIDISGYVFSDLNQDSLMNGFEYGIANVTLILTGVNYSYYTHTDNNGFYNFHVLYDVYTLEQYVPTNWNQLCPNGPNTYSINIPPGSTIALDFADTADYLFDDAEIWNCQTNPNTRGFNNYFNAQVQNNGTTQLFGNVIAIHDSVMAYIGASPFALYNVSTRTVQWTYSNLNPGAINNFSYWAFIPATTSLGTLMIDSTYVTPIATDIFPADNYCNYFVPVNGSYDPNNKTSTPEGDVQKDSLQHQYVIHFQNTGNNYALRVVVEDTLDTNLDQSSITDVTASHTFTFDSTSQPLKFIFDNIYLPDSNQDEQGSHGFVSFKIKHKTGLQQGTIIQNTGYIYFDFNSAIVTNTVSNTLVNAVGINEISQPTLTVYPNPTHDELHILFNGSIKQNYHLTLYDVLGKQVRHVPVKVQNKDFQLTMNLKNISRGVYLLLITDSQGNFLARKKVLVE